MRLRVEVGDHKVVTRDAVREPQLLKLQSGDLLLTYHVQPDSHFADRRGMRSADGGETWRPEPQRAHREQAMGQAADGTVLGLDIYTFEREPGEYVGSHFRSEDGGATFTGPRQTIVRAKAIASRGYPTAEHFPPPDHPLHKFFQPLPEYYHPFADTAHCRLGPSFWRYAIEADGRWLAPMQCRYHGDTFYRTILVESADGGATWDFVSVVATFRDGVPGDGFCEPAITAVPDGSLLCVMRRGGGLPLAQCRSRDGGKTWSEPEMLPGHGVDPDLFLMSSGVLACTYGRPGLHIMFSPDGCGYSWGYRTMIGEWGSSTYMGVAEVAPGELLVVYDHNQAKPGEDRRDPEKCYIGSAKVKVTAR